MKTLFRLFSFIAALLINMPTQAMESLDRHLHTEFQSFLNSITLEDWLNLPQDANTMLSILKLFNSSQARLLSNDHIWVNQVPKQTIDGLMTGKIKVIPQAALAEFYEYVPKIPFLAKWIIPNNNCIISIGDLHGNFRGLKDIIKNMSALNLFKNNGSMKLENNVKLIFLGDYMDRGYYPLETFATAALLYLNNPEQVIMLRGNHENIHTNLITYDLKLELTDLLDVSEEIISSIIEELSKSYEFLPVGAFVGYQDSLPTKFIFYAHACVDIRINCKDLLEFDAINLAQNGGLKLWKFGRENIMPPEELSRFYKDIIPNFDNLMKDFLEALTNPDPTAGFLWNDISYGMKFLLNRSERGPCVINLDICMIKKYLENYNSDNTKICGLVRGHQHSLPKETYKSMQKEQSASLARNPIPNVTSLPIYDDEMANQAIYGKITPACVVNIRTGPATTCILLSDTNSLNIDNDFWVTTLISSSIIENHDFQLSYPPTFLNLRYSQSTGQYSLQALYDTMLL